MMDWQFIFTAINSIVIIVTLVILIIQTWIFSKQMVILQEQTKAALEASSSLSHTQLWEMVLKIDDMFLEKPHLRKYFYEGVPLEENNLDEHTLLYAEAESAAEELLDIMEQLLGQATYFPKLYIHESGKIIWDTLYRYFIDIFISSPFLLAYAEKRRSWYAPQVMESMETAKCILNQRKVASRS